jgi:hypothetical protein
MNVAELRHNQAAEWKILRHSTIALAFLLEAHAAAQLASTGNVISVLGFKLDAGGVIGSALVLLFLYFRAAAAPMIDKARKNDEYDLKKRISRTVAALSTLTFLMLVSGIYIQFKLVDARSVAQAAPVKLAQARYDAAIDDYNAVKAAHGAKADPQAAAEANALREKARAEAAQAQAEFEQWRKTTRAINRNGKDSGKVVGQILSGACSLLSESYRTLAADYLTQCNAYYAKSREQLSGVDFARLKSLDGASSAHAALESARREMQIAKQDLLSAQANNKGADAEHFEMFSLAHAALGGRLSVDGVIIVMACLLAAVIVGVSNISGGCEKLAVQTEKQGGYVRREPGILDHARAWLAEAAARRARPAHFAPPFATGAGKAAEPVRKPATRAEMYRQWMEDNPGATRAACARHFGVDPAQVTRAFK